MLAVRALAIDSVDSAVATDKFGPARTARIRLPSLSPLQPQILPCVVAPESSSRVLSQKAISRHIEHCMHTSHLAAAQSRVLYRTLTDTAAPGTGNDYLNQSTLVPAQWNLL